MTPGTRPGGQQFFCYARQDHIYILPNCAAKVNATAQ